MISEKQFKARLAHHAQSVEELLTELLGDTAQKNEICRPPKLVAAMRYAALGGGKRLRPFLVMETAAMLNGGDIAALRVGAALECVHCYSLAHDDLPSMDDDDLRRGRPTLHRAFDEATAILAGDSLLTFAFEIIASPETSEDPATRIHLVELLARAAGMGGMAGGQMLDLEAEAREPGTIDISTMQAMKTGALFRFACEAGAVIAKANDEDFQRLGRFGQRIGAAFQVADDILDVTSSADELGKRVAKDAGRGKATLVAQDGIANARMGARDLLASALQELSGLQYDTSMLECLARFVISRNN